MKANRCPECKEVFITIELLDTCLSCGAAIPIKTKKPVTVSSKELPKVDEIAADEIINSYLKIKDEVHLLYNLVYGFLSGNNANIKSKKLTNEQLCDFGYLSKELAKIFDELRKECQAREKLCSSIIAYNVTQDAINNPSSSGRVSGELATATPRVKMQAALPKKLTEDYYKLTDFFGVSREIAKLGILKLDWKTVTEYCTERVNKGLKIPEGFGQQYPDYTATYRKKS